MWRYEGHASKIINAGEKMSRVVEVSGRIDAEGHLQLDEPLGAVKPGVVRVIVLIDENDEIGEREWLSAASKNPAFDFLKHPEEDIYTLSDGKPFYDEG